MEDNKYDRLSKSKYWPRKRFLNFYFWYYGVTPLTKEQLDLLQKIILDRIDDGK